MSLKVALDSPKRKTRLYNNKKDASKAVTEWNQQKWADTVPATQQKLLLFMADAWADMSNWQFIIFRIKYWSLTFQLLREKDCIVFFSLKKGRGGYGNRRYWVKNYKSIGSSKISKFTLIIQADLQNILESHKNYFPQSAN